MKISNIQSQQNFGKGLTIRTSSMENLKKDMSRADFDKLKNLLTKYSEKPDVDIHYYDKKNSGVAVINNSELHSQLFYQSPLDFIKSTCEYALKTLKK